MPMAKTKITGYWTFFCNPKYWDVQEFLMNIDIGFNSEYRITSWQKKYFEKGQFGVIRVGADGRTASVLNGREKLAKGVYAIVEIMGPAFQHSASVSSFKIEHQKGESDRYMVPIRYVRNYIRNPVLFSEIENDTIMKSDSYLLKGIQAASMPLQEDVFNRILLYGEESPESN